MKINITSIQRYDKGKDNQPLINKNGKPYTRLVLKTKEYGEKTMSGFDNEQSKNLQVGDEIEAEVTENGQYLNFKLPSEKDKQGQTQEAILKIVTNHTFALARIEELLKSSAQRQEERKENYPDLDIPEGEPPF